MAPSPQQRTTRGHRHRPSVQSRLAPISSIIESLSQGHSFGIEATNGAGVRRDLISALRELRAAMASLVPLVVKQATSEITACPLCGPGFPEGDLVWHNLVNHHILAVYFVQQDIILSFFKTRADRPFYCSFCLKDFSSINYFRAHLCWECPKLHADPRLYEAERSIPTANPPNVDNMTTTNSAQPLVSIDETTSTNGHRGRHSFNNSNERVPSPIYVPTTYPSMGSGAPSSSSSSSTSFSTRSASSMQEMSPSMTGQPNCSLAACTPQMYPGLFASYASEYVRPGASGTYTAFRNFP